jgi:hypothetical protein
VNLRHAIGVSAAIGAAVATYLTVLHYTHTSPICTSGGCEKVQISAVAALCCVTRLLTEPDDS